MSIINETGAPQDVGLWSYLNGITPGRGPEAGKQVGKSQRVVCGPSKTIRTDRTCPVRALSAQWSTCCTAAENGPVSDR